jgi:hypothetical protein
MLNICIFVLQVLLFVLLTPGILLVLPPKSSKYIVALTHGIVFSALWILLYKPFCRFCSVMKLEGLTENVKDMSKGEDDDEE